MAAALVAGLVPGLAGGTALAVGEVSAPATWQAGDLAVVGLQSGGDHLLGTTGPAQYAYGVAYDGALDGASGVLITGQGLTDAQGGPLPVTVLAGDSLTGSAVLWSDADTGAGAGIAGVDGESSSANLGGALTGISSQDPVTGAQQVRWSITNATVDGVDASATTPSILQAGYTDGSGPSGQVSVFVASPTLDASLEVCTTGTDCDPAAAAGAGGWATSATLPEGTANVAWRISATNTGNVDLTDVKVATADAGSGDLSACLGASIGDLPVGLSSTVTCTTPTAGISTASVSVSGVFAGQGPDGQPLVNRFTDAAGTTGRVPSPAATATLITAGSPAPSASTPGVTPSPSASTSGGAGTQAVDVTLSLASPTSGTGLSGITFSYQIGISCGAVQGATCDGVVVSIPIPPDLAPSGATNPSDWTTLVAGVDPSLIPSSAQVVDGQWVITMGRSMTAGESQLFTFQLTPPNGTTPDNTTWTLTATATGSNVTTAVSDPVTATATASALCNVENGANEAAPINSTRTFSVGWVDRGGAQTGALFDDPNAPAPTMTYQVPDGFTFVSATDGGTYDANSGLVTWILPLDTSTPTSVGQYAVTLTMPETTGTYTEPVAAQHTPIGEALMTCGTTATISVTDASISGQIWIKNAIGFSQYGMQNAQGATSGTGDYVQTVSDGVGGESSYFDIMISRQSATVQDLHLFDGMPCLVEADGVTPQADGKTVTTPFRSLTADDPPCAAPAINVTSIWLPSTPLDGETATVVYSDGSSEAIPDGTFIFTVPANKMVASLIVDGSYNVNDPDYMKEIKIYGRPVASLPSDDIWYVMNSATMSGANITTDTVYVGMVTTADTALLYNSNLTNTYLFTDGWSGGQYLTFWTFWGGSGAVATTPAWQRQQRYAMVLPANSGIAMNNMYGNVQLNLGQTGIFPTVTDNYDGLGDDLYLVDASSVDPFTGVGISDSFGGMAPGIYQYYTYTGFTDMDPTDGGASCTAMGGTLVTDTTGIIAPVGTPRLLCRATNTIIVQSPGAGLLVAKQVANVTDGEVFHASPYVSDGLAGQTMQFRVQIANIGTSDLSDAVVYDLLPHAGDTGTIASQADVSRGSTQTPILTAVTPPDGWTIEYSSSANPCRPELNVTTNCDDTATWSTSLPMDQVASIRLTSPDAGVSAYSEMILTYTVPPAGQWSSGDIVFNSVGATATQGGAQLPPTEAPKVGFRYPSATLIWYKTDPSGDPLAGATFEVTGPDGFDQTVTDNVGLDADPTDGTFMLANGLTVGDYTITETAAPDGYAINTTPLHATIDTAGATVTAGTVVDLPLLTPVTMYVQKKGEATSGDEVPMAGSTWQVLADDSGQPGDAVDTATLSPATDAQQAPITGLWQIDGLTPGVYWLAETSAPHGFSLLPAPVQFTIDGQGQVVLGANAGTGTNALVTAAAGGDDQAPWWVVTVHDVPAVVLPLTGGAGDIPWLVGGALATAGAILFMIGGYLGRAGRRPRRRVTTIRT